MSNIIKIEDILKDKAKISILCIFSLSLIGMYLGSGNYIINDKQIQSVIFNFSSNLLTASLISGFFEFVIRKKFVLIIKNLLETSIEDAISNYSNIAAKGIKNLHNDFPDPIFREKLETAKNVVILQTFIPDTPLLLKSIRKMVANGGQIRILIVHPDEAGIISMRAKTLGKPDLYIKREIIKDILDLKNLRKDIDDEVNIMFRGCRVMPSVSIYSTDDTLFVGNFLINTNAIEGAQLEFDNSSRYSKLILDEFNRLWEDHSDDLSTYDLKEFSDGK